MAHAGVMRMLKVMLMLIVTLGLAGQGLAQTSFKGPDYAKIKGDFKILMIGDTRDTVEKKLNYLSQAGEISEVTGTDRFLGETLGEKISCSFRYHRTVFGAEQVQQMVIDFYEHHLTPAQFELGGVEFTKYLQTMLEKTYRTPTYVSPYLFVSQIKENQDKYTAKWMLNTKTVGVAVTRNQSLINTRIIISSPTLNEDLKKDEVQDFN